MIPYQQALQLSTDGVLMIDAQQVIRFCNDAFCDMLGIHRLEVLSKKISEASLGSDITEAFLEQNLSYRRVFVTNKSGGPVQLDLHLYEIGENSTRFQIGYFRNESEKIRQQLELRETVRRLDEFAYLASHKLRHPVANIMGLIELLDLSSSDPAEKDQLLTHLRQMAGQLNDAIHELNKSLDRAIEPTEHPVFPEKQNPRLLMLVDDDAVNAFITQSVLRRSDPSIMVMHFHEPSQAIQYLIAGNELPAMIMLEIHLNLFTENMFLQKMKAHQVPDIPFWIIRNQIDGTEDQWKKKYPSFRGFLIKPVTIEKMSRLFSQ